MIELTEVQTVHAFIHIARASKSFVKCVFRDSELDCCDAVGAIYHQFGQEQAGLTGTDALFWGICNVKLHRPTVDLLIELNDVVFSELTPELRRDALLYIVTEYSHMLYVENANLDMYGKRY